MNYVCFCPKTGGQQNRQFHSLRRAKDFLPEACRQDFAGFAYLIVARHAKAIRLEQWQRGKLNYRANNPAPFIHGPISPLAAVSR